MGKNEAKLLEEVYQEGRNKSDEEVARLKGELQEKTEREQRIAECHQVIGRIQATKMFVKFGNVSELMWIRGVKETALYKALPGIGTWEKFCNSIGYTSKHIDEQLKNLNALGAEFLETVSHLRVGYRDLRKLRQLTHCGTLQIEDGLIQIGDESIPLDAEHREDLQSAMERLLDAKDALVAEKDATLRTKDRLIDAKEDVIRRQAKDLSRFEGEAEKKGLSADEDAFIKQCGAARVSIDGFFAKFDPEYNPLPEGASIRMKSALMETLGYFKRVTAAAYDTAGDLYGDAELDGSGWVPPHLRAAGEALAVARQKKTDREG